MGSGDGPAFPRTAQRGHRAAAGDPSQQVCPGNPAQPLIEPAARQMMNVDAANQIVDGTGIKVGIIADGIDPNNPDLIRADSSHVIFDYQDFSGFGAPTDGREAFLDAGRLPRRADIKTRMITSLRRCPGLSLAPGIAQRIGRLVE